MKGTVITEGEMAWLIRHGPQPVLASFGSEVRLVDEKQAENLAALQLYWARGFLA